ncbi:MAG: hypothetical protein K2I30_06245 [Clostridia bacterium]|nr:hypothetical protein [Clostridia bacterium]
MSKNYPKKRRFKYVMLALACTASFSLTGVAAACKKADDNNEDEDDKKTSVVDDQLLKNGNFEIFEVPDDAVHLIKTPTSWSKGGSSSYTMSGIIGTSPKAWEALTDGALADKLDANNDLDPSDDNYKDLYVDYNGMKSSDILYQDTYKALNVKTSADGEDDEEEVDEHAKDLIANPGTHYAVKSDDNGLYYIDENGDRQTVYENEDGDYFLDEKFEKPISHVLMLHNYATAHNGTAQNYSSVSVDLPANTSAEISVWVKTAYLKYSQGKEVEQDRGANITVTHTVGSTTLDDFAITCINTEKLIGENKADGKYDGWVKYTLYINACDFAASSVTLKLGLGESDYNTEGYAFFDDVKVTRFTSLDNENCTYSSNESKIGNAKCDLSSDKSEKIFKADSYTRNEGLSTETTDKRFSENFHYLLDLASTDEYGKVTFGTGVKAGLTVDEDNYASALVYDGKKIGFTSIEGVGDAKLPKDFDAPKTHKDLLAYVKADYNFTEGQTEYYERLNNALKSAVNLPKLDSTTDNNMLVMLSARGAAYTSTFDIEVKGEGQQIISFWVKTSDMNGATAATVKLTDADDKDSSVSINVDSTNVKTDLDDENEDIYDGWVQCFFFVKNENSEAKKLTVEFSFGNTTIKDTSASGYKAGWVALANMQTLEVDEDVYAYTGSGEYTASLTLSETEKKTTQVFDEVYGSQSNQIKENISDPSTYQGVNGGSSAIVNNGFISLPFDDINKNGNAGLINKEYFENYANQDWYAKLLSAFNVDNASSITAIDAWNEIFGSTSVQPLIIVNSLREGYVRVKGATADTYKNYWYKDEKGAFVKVAETDEFDEEKDYYSTQEVINYGFVGESKTISSNGYSTVSVRVKVSRGAIAYVYLADTSAGKKVLDFSAPRFTFRYDEDGNVLKAELKKDATLSERRENVLYTLRDDGLYEDENGKLFANVWNLKKVYNDESLAYFDADGNSVSFDDLKDGETYYATSEGKNGAEANCHLTTTDNKKIYEFKDGKYYYMVEGKAASEVTPFDTSFARYDYSGISEEYFAEINGNDANVAGKWITVNFVINAGSEAKNYRLELWSGVRDEYKTAGNTENGAVIFDYSYNSITDDSLMEWYEGEIIDAYKNLLVEKNLIGEGFESSTENIKYYAELVQKYIDDGKLTSAEVEAYANGILASYKAHYYTFSLYDSANFKPFNKDVAAENETGYDYDINNYEETLAYLSVKDENSYTVFANYSAIDQSFTTNTDDGDDGTEDGDNENDNTTVWLLVSSILLVAALLFTIASIMIRDMIKKKRKNKVTGKNAYDQQKRNRYIRKLHIQKEEFEEVDRKAENAEISENEDTAENSEATENDTTDAAPVETADAIEEARVEESSAEADEPQASESVESTENATVEETPAEDIAETSDDASEKNKDGDAE